MAKEESKPLWNAVSDDCLHEVVLLLEARADPNEGDVTGETPLFEAAVNGYLDICAALLLHGADPRAADNTNVKARDLATDEGVQRVMDYFLNEDVDDQALQDTVLEMKEPVKTQFSLMLNVLKESTTSVSPDSEIVDDVVADFATGLIHDEATSLNQSFPLGVIDEETLTDDEKSLHSGPMNNDKAPCTQQIFDLDRGDGRDIATDVSQPSEGLSNSDEDMEKSPLATAVRRQSLPDVLDLLINGANPNEANSVGETLLFDAAKEGNANIMAALMIHSADPRRESMNYMVPSDVASDNAVQDLLEVFSGAANDGHKKRKSLEILDVGLQARVSQFLKDAEIPTGHPQQQKQDSQVNKQPSIKCLLDMSELEDEESTQLDGKSKESELDDHLHSDRTSTRCDFEMSELEEEVEASEEQQGSPTSRDTGVTSLVAAIQRDDLSGVLKLLEEGADPNSAHIVGHTLLADAVLVGNPDIVAALLIFDADVTETSVDAVSPLQLESHKSVKAMLRLCGNLEQDLGSETEALNALSISMRSRMAHYLDTKPGRLAKCNDPRPPTTSSAKELLRLNATENHTILSAASLETRLTEAASHEDLNKGTSKNLLVAVQAQNYEEVLGLLRSGADPNVADSDTGETPLFSAVATGNASIVAALLLHSANPCHRSRCFILPEDFTKDTVMKDLLHMFTESAALPESELAVLEALNMGLREEMALHLQNLRAKNEKTVPRELQQLVDAAYHGDLPEVLQLLRKRVDVNGMNAHGRSPLSQALAHGRADIAAALLLHSADPCRAYGDAHAGAAIIPGSGLVSLLDIFAEPQATRRTIQAALEILGDSMRSAITEYLQAKKTQPLPLDLANQHQKPVPSNREVPQLLPSGDHEVASPAPAAVDALVHLFNGGMPRTDSERMALATLDPKTVGVVLAAAMQHLQELGVRVHIRKP